MKRRLVLLVLASLGLFVTPPTSQAQSTKAQRIGFLSPASLSSMAARLDAFKEGLLALGYAEGQNIIIEYRWGEGKDARLTDFAADLARRNVQLLLVHGVLAAQAARRASSTIPIVCFACGDVIGTRLVDSLARPGGNITGMTVIAPEVSGKRLELLREIIPGLTRVAVLWNSSNPVSIPELKETETAARSLGLQIQAIGVADAERFQSAFSSMTRERAEAVLVLSDAMFFGRRKQISDLAVTHRLPAISWTGEFARAGSLIGYGPDVFDMARRAANYVEKILKGARPADLPIEQPTKFELAINLKTAGTLGLTIPPSLLLRADHVVD